MFCRTCGHELNDNAAVCVGCGCPPFAGNQFCQNCRTETLPAAVACVKCGAALKTNSISFGGGPMILASEPAKDPILMALLSACCLSGLGQILLGQTMKGVAILVVSILLAIVTAGLSVPVTFPLGGVDAYLIAKKLKDGKAVGQWEFF